MCILTKLSEQRVFVYFICRIQIVKQYGVTWRKPSYTKTHIIFLVNNVTSR